MGNSFDEEIYACNSEEYEEYFAKIHENRTCETDINREDMLSKYAEVRHSLSK